jgi:hypothetical protein
MRDFRDAKAMAQTLRAALAAMGSRITVSQSLELIAKAFGLGDWNTLSAAIRSPTTAAPGDVSPQAAPNTAAAGIAGDTQSPPAPKPLSAELVSTLNQVFAFAKAQRHELITVEHLALFILAEADISRVMQALGANLDELRKKLVDNIDRTLTLEMTQGAAPAPTPTLGFQRVLQRAVFHVQQANRHPVKAIDVFVAIFSEKHSHAVQLFGAQGVARIDVVNYMTHGLVKGRGGPAIGPPPV